ncbi:MAG: hypothetical protein KBT11_01595 [Treponema sp.]|nr:hypothetical protein [Candidatus Treponema equifaecale]
MAKKSSSLFWTILNLAVGVMLAVGGIWALQGGGDFAAKALKGLSSGDMSKILGIVFGVIELLSGIFIILQLFIGDRMGQLGTILKLIIVIVWAVAIVIADILNGNFGNFLSWLYTFAGHLIVLAALLVTRD